MTEQDTNIRPAGRVAACAHIISGVFSPLLMPVYATAAALWLTMLRFLPLNVKLWVLAGTFFITGVIPGLTIYVLVRMGRVSDAAVSDRRQRPVPMAAAVLCYSGAAWYMSSMSAPAWLTAFFIGAAVSTVLALIISFRWKISAHSIGMAGFATAIYWMAVHGLIAYSSLLWISLAVAMWGATAWARLYLNHHTPMQIFAGAALAAAVMYCTLSFTI